MSHHLYVQSFFALGNRITCDVKLRRPFQGDITHWQIDKPLTKANLSFEVVPWSDVVDELSEIFNTILAAHHLDLVSDGKGLHPKAVDSLTRYLRAEELGQWEYDVERNQACLDTLGSLTVWY